MRNLKLEPAPVSDALRAALTSAGLLVDDLDCSERSYFAFVAADRRVVGYSGLETATTGAESFFELIGFTSVERDRVPPAILSTRQLSGLCSASATS